MSAYNGLRRLLWAVPESPGYHEIEWDAQEIADAKAALDTVRSFTWEDVDSCRDAAEDAEVNGTQRPHPLHDLAARIAALLPPREEG